MKEGMVKIIFVCSANRFRSVIAAGYFSSLLVSKKSTGDLIVESAGTWAYEGLPPLPDVIKFAAVRGFPVEDVRSREINQEMMTGAGLIIVMTEGHKEALNLEFPQFRDKVFMLSEVCINSQYDIPDLGENEDESVEVLGSEICSLLDKGFENICIIISKNKK